MAFFETKHEKKSLIITIVINVLLLLILFFFGFTYLDPPPENGIAVNFGTAPVGSGEIPNQPAKTAPKQETVTPQETTPETTPEVNEKVVSQETEEAPVIEDKEKKEKETTKKTTPKKEEKKEAEKPKKEEPPKKEAKKPDPKPDKSTSDALNSFLNGPEKDGKENGGDGNDKEAGNKGDPNGDPNANSYYGHGKGIDGDGNYRLGGRKALNKEKFVQDCNESGTVVVKIEVNQNGTVTNAVAGVKGTTNTSPCLLEPARRAALATKFNSDADAPVKQVGTIIYEFKLSE